MSDWLVFLRTTPAQPGEGPLTAQAAICPADTGAQAVTAVLEARLMIPQPGAVIEAVDVADARVYDVEMSPIVTRQDVVITPPIQLPDEPDEPGELPPDEPDIPDEEPVAPDEPDIPDEPVAPDEPAELSASFTYDRPVMGADTQFDATASTGSIETYDWTFAGVKQSDAGPTPTWQFAKNGTYTVKLVVTDADGATATDSQSVKVLTA